jgi:hypothetical protein
MHVGQLRSSSTRKAGKISNDHYNTIVTEPKIEEEKRIIILYTFIFNQK